MTRNTTLLLTLGCCLALANLSLSAGPEAPKDVTAKLEEFQKLIGEQQKQMAEQQKKIAEQDRKIAEQDRKLSDLARKQDDDKLKAARHEEIKKVLEEMNAAAAKQGDRLAVWSKMDIQFYGYVKADMSFDTSRVSVGNYARWVEPEGLRHHDAQGDITAKETRLGMKINGPANDTIKTVGVVEFDFYGDAAENKAVPMMRHAYMQIDWVKEKFSILAGQTWDVISPLNPPTLNYSVGWWVGNIGYRRPQIRLTKIVDVTKDVEWKLEAAAARNIGHKASTGYFGPLDSGQDSAMPVFQGRTSWSFPLFCSPTTVGLSGHFGREEFDIDAANHSEKLDSWSGNLDLSMPILKWLAIKGELFTGENLDAYLGGIGQGIDLVNNYPANGIGSCGGWAAVTLTPWKKWQFNVGASGEAVSGEDVSSPAARTLNRAIFGNVIYEITTNTFIGFELSQWHTEYKAGDAADSMRFQTSFIYRL